MDIMKGDHWDGLIISHSDNVPLVPYGCWFRGSTETGTYINLGSNVLIEDRGRLYNLLKTQDRTDTYFCSKALQQGYTSIVTNLPIDQVHLKLGSETIICYGGCSTVRFNTTCPPGIELRTGKTRIGKLSEFIGILTPNR